MLLIFRGEYPPGSRLPAERVLAPQLGVDRTTLRMAVKQLARMGIVEARHGSGVQVADYARTCGMDVLAAMFSLDELPLEGAFIVEALDFWIENFSLTIARALGRASPEELQGVERMLDRAIAAGSDRNALLQAQLDLQTELVRLSGSMLFGMFNNSMRTLRTRIMRMLPETSEVTQWLQAQKRFLLDAAAQRPEEAVVRARMANALRELTAGVLARAAREAPS